MQSFITARAKKEDPSGDLHTKILFHTVHRENLRKESVALRKNKQFDAKIPKFVWTANLTMTKNAARGQEKLIFFSPHGGRQKCVHDMWA